MKIIRVFPCRTKATPDDDLVFVGEPPAPLFGRAGFPETDEIHVSCTFTWDRQEAQRLAAAWSRFHPRVLLGGPAFPHIYQVQACRGGHTMNMISANHWVGVFVPGLYLKRGYTITTRGCPNTCPWCLVPDREGPLRLLPIQPGHDVLDNNLLAAPQHHIRAVLRMLATQPRGARFTGGLQASLVAPWFVREIGELRAAHKLDCLFLAYDRESELDAVAESAAMFTQAGLRRWQMACYCLIGTPGDTPALAAARLDRIVQLGLQPFAMFYRGPDATTRSTPAEWRALVKKYIRPGATFATRGLKDADGTSRT
ncbi:MAG TPA: hypothetical protein VM223_25745 [Planctomycetota bacterium]|nr:hypothetical protein [Planctomycetota bacterium]